MCFNVHDFLLLFVEVWWWEKVFAAIGISCVSKGSVPATLSTNSSPFSAISLLGVGGAWRFHQY